MINEMEKDLRYIKNDIIGKQVNGLFCKYSKLAKSITITNLTKDIHLKYWLSVYKVKYNPDKYPEKYNEASKLIIEAINDKFENGLTDLDIIIDLENKSTDSKKEKDKIIKHLTTTEIPKIQSKPTNFEKKKVAINS